MAGNFGDQPKALTILIAFAKVDWKALIFERSVVRRFIRWITQGKDRTCGLEIWTVSRKSLQFATKNYSKNLSAQGNEELLKYTWFIITGWITTDGDYFAHIGCQYWHYLFLEPFCGDWMVFSFNHLVKVFMSVAKSERDGVNASVWTFSRPTVKLKMVTLV